MVIDSPGQFKTKRRGGGDKINTIFTPKQLLGHCFDIVRYLALSPLSESPETLSEKLSTFNRYTGVRVRNIEHGFNQGMITIYKRDISGESIGRYLDFNLTSTFSTAIGCEGDSASCSFDAYGGGFITDSYLGCYDMLPLTDWELEQTTGGVIEVTDYIKNHFIIFIPKYCHKFDNYIIKYGVVNDDGSYSIYRYRDYAIPVTIPNVFSGTMQFGDIYMGNEPLSFTIDDSAVVSYDSTKSVPVENSISEEEIEVTKSYTIRDRVDYSVEMARYNQYDIMRGDYSSFDLVDDIKIQLPEEQADILTNFKKYIN